MSTRMRITASDLATKRWLEVDQQGITFYEGSVFGNKRTFSFEQIRCILVSPAGVLSFQVGEEVFSLAVKALGEEHRRVIEAFVQGAQRAAGMQETSPLPPPPSVNRERMDFKDAY